jgi:hypothetical protein
MLACRDDGDAALKTNIMLRLRAGQQDTSLA